VDAIHEVGMMRGAQQPSLHRSQNAGTAHNTNGFPLH